MIIIITKNMKNTKHKPVNTLFFDILFVFFMFFVIDSFLLLK